MRTAGARPTWSFPTAWRRSSTASGHRRKSGEVEEVHAFPSTFTKEEVYGRFKVTLPGGRECSRAQFYKLWKLHRPNHVIASPVKNFCNKCALYLARKSMRGENGKEHEHEEHNEHCELAWSERRLYNAVKTKKRKVLADHIDRHGEAPTKQRCRGKFTPVSRVIVFDFSENVPGQSQRVEPAQDWWMRPQVVGLFGAVDLVIPNGAGGNVNYANVFVLPEGTYPPRAGTKEVLPDITELSVDEARADANAAE